jgi:tetratricopeptide (TPR) repeat protein
MRSILTAILAVSIMPVLARQIVDSELLSRLEAATASKSTDPRVWYALGQTYNTVKQQALRSFDEGADRAAWQQLLAADALMANGQFTDAFAAYRAAQEHLPSMVSIHDSVARIYESIGKSDWAARERKAGALAPAACEQRKALCEFRAGRYRSALTAAVAGSDPEARYWQARAAAELALAAFKHLDELSDSGERRVVRATLARNEGRYVDAIAELTAALTFAPGDPALLFELASAYYAARDYEQAIATLSPMLAKRPDDPRLLQLTGFSLLQLRRAAEAVPVLQKAAAADDADPGTRLALARAYLQDGRYAAAIPLLEAAIPGDQDGSLHVQLARAYRGMGQREKGDALLAKAGELQRAADERARAAAKRTITAPK